MTGRLDPAPRGQPTPLRARVPAAGHQGDLPRDLETLRTLILARLADCPKRLATLARYAVDHPDDIAFGSVASIAKAAQVAPSTLVRFGQFLGYSGFSDLQSVFQQAARTRIAVKAAAHAASDAGAARSHRTVIQETVEACRVSIDTMGETILLTDIRAASDILATARSIFVLADTDAIPFASFFHRRLAEMNIRVILLTDMAAANDILAFASQCDAAVILETAPFGIALEAHAVTLKDRKIPIVCMTDTALSPTAALAGLRFDLAGAGGDALSRVTAGIVLADALANGIRASLQAR